MKIDLLEDDPEQAALLRVWLEEEGHTVRWFRQGSELTRALHREVPDVLVLDWLLPESSGIDVLTWVRQSFLGQIPVIFITAQDREEHVVTALQAGADDYLVKPARRRELIARITALGRRAGVVAPGNALTGTDPFTFDLNARTVHVGNKAIEMTSKEFDLAVYLFSNSGRLVTRTALLERVWGRSSDAVSTRTVDAHVSRIRKKLDLDESTGWQLISIYQHGYRLEHSSGT
jgi:two-component system, OmpR family, response regulator RegX3